MNVMSIARPAATALLSAIASAAFATNYYWGSDAGDGDFEDTSKWRLSKPSGSAANASPLAVTDTAIFGNGVTGTVAVGSFTAAALPNIHFLGGSDIALNLPSGVVSSPGSTYTSNTGNGIGSPWSFGSGVGRLVIAGGTLDMRCSPIIRNNAGTPQLIVRSATLRNSSWQPAEKDTASSVVFGAESGATVENFTLTLPNYISSESGHALPRVWFAGEGTTVSNLSLAATGNAVISPCDVCFTNGVKVVDSALMVNGGGTMLINGASTFVTNTTVQLKCSAATLAVTNATMADCTILFAGVASNETSTNNCFSTTGSLFDGCAFELAAWTANANMTFGQGTVMRNLSSFALSGHECDCVIEGTGTAIDAGDIVLTPWAGHAVWKNTISTSSVFTVKGGASLECAGFRAGSAIAGIGHFRNVVRVSGEGSTLTVRPFASGFNNGVAPVWFEQITGSNGSCVSNRVEISDGGTFAILRRDGESYPASYGDSVFFAHGYNSYSNCMVVSSGGVFTNEFGLAFGNNYYNYGGFENSVVVSNGVFHCDGNVRLAPRSNNYGNMLVAEAGGIVRAGEIRLSEAASGGSLVCRDSTVTVTNRIVSAASEGTSIVVGGSRGGISASYIDNTQAETAKATLAFEIPSSGKTDGKPYMDLTSDISGDRMGGIRAGTSPTVCGFTLSLDISPKFAKKPRSSAYVDLVQTVTTAWNKKQLGLLMETASSSELVECSLAVVDADDGHSVLRLYPCGTGGFVVFVR